MPVPRGKAWSQAARAVPGCAGEPRSQPPSLPGFLSTPRPALSAEL